GKWCRSSTSRAHSREDRTGTEGRVEMRGLVRSKRRGALVALTAAVAGFFVLAAAGSNPKTIKIGAALLGPKNDKSFDQANYEGIQLAVKQNPGKLKLTSVLENL